MTSTSQRSRLSKGFKLASLLTLFLGMASTQSLRTEVQAVQQLAQVTVESTVSTAWQSEPVTLPVRASQIGLSQDGQRAIAITNRSSNAEGGCLEVWNVQTKELIFSAPATEDIRFESAAISDDGLQVAAIVRGRGRDLSLWIWDIASDQPPTQKRLNEFQPFFGPAFSSNSPNALSSFASISSKIAFSPDATKIVTSVKRLTYQTIHKKGPVLQLHSAATGEILHVLAPTTSAQIGQLAFSPDGKQLAGAGRIIVEDGAAGLAKPSVVNIWSTSNGQLTSSFSPDEVMVGEGVSNELGYVAAIAFTPTGQLKTLSNLNLTSNQLVTWDLSMPLADSQVQVLREVDRQDFTHVLSPDGVYQFMHGDVAGARLLNTQTLEVTQIDERVSEAAFSTDGNYLAIVTPENVQIFFKSDR